MRHVCAKTKSSYMKEFGDAWGWKWYEKIGLEAEVGIQRRRCTTISFSTWRGRARWSANSLELGNDIIRHGDYLLAIRQTFFAGC